MSPAPDLGIVVIGRNEGARLIRCLDSLADAGAPVVYVDSGSNDGSPEVAAARGAQVVDLDTSQGFTAARARNAGLEALRCAHPGLAFVQFVDGDCEVVPGWLSAARAALEANPRLAAVAGRRRERFPDASIFNRLCDMEWNIPLGRVRTVGGDALYRDTSLQEANGFNAELICGEEPDLCLRLARLGWSVERIDYDMTIHDAAMIHCGQWWKREKRGGWAYAEGAYRYGQDPERFRIGEVRSIFTWGGVVPAMILASIIAAFAFAVAGAQFWPVPTLFAALGLTAYAAMAWRIALYRCATHDDPPTHARLYGTLTMLAKFPQLLGVLAYHATRWRGRDARIIEYKDARAAKAGTKGV